MLAKVYITPKNDKDFYVHNVKDKRKDGLNCVGIEIVDLENDVTLSCVVTTKALLDAVISVMDSNNWMYYESEVAKRVIYGLAFETKNM